MLRSTTTPNIKIIPKIRHEKYISYLCFIHWKQRIATITRMKISHSNCCVCVCDVYCVIWENFKVIMLERLLLASYKYHFRRHDRKYGKHSPSSYSLALHPQFLFLSSAPLKISGTKIEIKHSLHILYVHEMYSRQSYHIYHIYRWPRLCILQFTSKYLWSIIMLHCVIQMGGLSKAYDFCIVPRNSRSHSAKQRRRVYVH